MANPVRRIHDASFKTKVVLEALKGSKTLAQLGSEFGIHVQMITERSGVPLERQASTVSQAGASAHAARSSVGWSGLAAH